MEHKRNKLQPEYTSLNAGVRVEDFLCERVPLYVSCWRCGRTDRFDAMKLLIFARQTARLTRLQEKLRCRRCGQRSGTFAVLPEDAARLVSKEELKGRR
jgi:hypothetical protein